MRSSNDDIVPSISCDAGVASLVVVDDLTVSLPMVSVYEVGTLCVVCALGNVCGVGDDAVVWVIEFKEGFVTSLVDTSVADGDVEDVMVVVGVAFVSGVGFVVVVNIGMVVVVSCLVVVVGGGAAAVAFVVGATVIIVVGVNVVCVGVVVLVDVAVVNGLIVAIIVVTATTGVVVAAVVVNSLWDVDIAVVTG